MNKILGIALLLISLSGCVGPETRLTRVYDGIRSAEQKHDIKTVNALAATISGADLSRERLGKCSGAELKLLYGILRKAAFYSPDDEDFVARQEAVFNESVRRGKAEEEDVERMVSAFLSARMFEKAKALKERYPKMELSDIPEKILNGNEPGPGPWRAYAVSDNGKTLELVDLPLSTGPKIVIVMFPGCGAMESAMRNILSDPELAPIFRANAVMITRRSEFSGTEEVKERFGFQEVYVVRKSADFPGLLLQSSPRFYFLKDGKVLHQLRGWSDDDNGAHPKKELRKGLMAIGLM